MRGKTSPEGTCKLLPLLKNLFSSLLRYITGKSSSAALNPGYGSFCCKVSFRSGRVLQLGFNEVSVNPFRRLPGTQRSHLQAQRCLQPPLKHLSPLVPVGSAVWASLRVQAIPKRGCRSPALSCPAKGTSPLCKPILAAPCCSC